MEASTSQIKLRPRVAEAVRVWDGLPSAERKYKRVSEIMNITEGRAAVYVRDGLVKLGRGDETPRGNAGGSGSTSGAGARQVSDFEQQLKDLIDRNRSLASQFTTEMDEAEDAVEKFDGDQYISDEADRMEKAIEEMQARLTAWVENTDDLATKSAEAEATRLRERAESLRKSNAEQIDKAIAAAEQAEAFLATIVPEETKPDGDESGDESREPDSEDLAAEGATTE